ncbi:TrkH family potassium uptake protein [Mariluticola halotolerans]|uniref:TrkH family potassium uptake protein n=1 Tax=Mariluticola halotolerans TaxID=2909283 RepID=UPI0026E2347F|nr:TrkH family potassium uptake protein [Mariluticola halotolerans]UJQ95639.1 TrkH family potassium uptake protein [Mariluticola halotolerans]
MYLATAYVCGSFGLFLSIFMLIPMMADLLVGNDDWQSFLAAFVFVGTAGVLLIAATRREIPPFSLRFGFLLVNGVWATGSLVGAVPLLLSAEGLSFTDAMFESVSGLTATGGTILSGLDAMPPGILLWRSLMQWFGGLGIIAMGLLLLPFLRVGGMHIYRMESSLQTDNPFSRFGEFSGALVSLYVGLTLACILAYVATGMSLFDAVNHAMTTISTGGFSTHDASMGAYGNATLLVSTVFMIAGALPFIALLKAAVTGNPKDAFELQIPVLLSILAVLSLVVALSAIAHTDDAALDMFVAAAFNITSIVTTTGFASQDYTLWGPLAVSIFLLATFLGGAAGSTSGGIKTYRLIILFQSFRSALKELVYPHGIFTVRYGDVEVSSYTIRSVALFTAAFLGLLLFSTIALSATGLDLLTSFTGALTALTNVGPGLGDIIGPAGNFSSLSDAAKWIMIIAMLLGRLEILTVLVLISPTFWGR